MVEMVQQTDGGMLWIAKQFFGYQGSSPEKAFAWLLQSDVLIQRLVGGEKVHVLGNEEAECKWVMERRWYDKAKKRFAVR